MEKGKVKESIIDLSKVKTFKEIIENDNPSIIGNHEEISHKIMKEFGLSVSKQYLYSIDNPTISEIEEDYRLIYKRL